MELSSFLQQAQPSSGLPHHKVNGDPRLLKRPVSLKAEAETMLLLLHPQNELCCSRTCSALSCASIQMLRGRALQSKAKIPVVSCEVSLCLCNDLPANLPILDLHCNMSASVRARQTENVKHSRKMCIAVASGLISPSVAAVDHASDQF